MNPQDAIDLGRESVKACLLVGGPVLLASLVIGLLVGIVQAMTQVQDQTVSFVPKLLCLLVVLGLCLPWLTDQMVDYTTETFGKPMTHFHALDSGIASRFSCEPPKLHSASTRGFQRTSGDTTAADSTIRKPSWKSPFSCRIIAIRDCPKKTLTGERDGTSLWFFYWFSSASRALC